MSDDRAFENATSEWLESGSDGTPPHAIEAVLLAIRTTPQERDLRVPWGTVHMPAVLRFAALVAIVAVAAVVTINLMRSSPDTGVGGPPSAASPSVQPTGSAAAAASPSVEPTASAATSPTAAPSATPSSAFTTYLNGYGQRFTPAQPPPGAADWRPAVEGFPAPGARVQSAIYGVVTCYDPSRNCAERGLVRPGESLPIWIVTFEDDPAAQGCRFWASVDATTGSFINGSGPPC